MTTAAGGSIPASAGIEAVAEDGRCPMRGGLVGLALAAISLAPESARAQDRPLELVDSVDLARYAGKWYEIARLPNEFQEQCVSDVTAEYTLRRDGRIDVVNTCRKADDELESVRGEAKKADEDGPGSRLKVRFAPAWLSWLPFVWGDYQIIALAEDYSHALVGSPDRRFLWVLARAPDMSDEQLEVLLEEAGAQGFDVSRVRRTLQGMLSR